MRNWRRPGAARARRRTEPRREGGAHLAGEIGAEMQPRSSRDPRRHFPDVSLRRASRWPTQCSSPRRSRRRRRRARASPPSASSPTRISRSSSSRRQSRRRAGRDAARRGQRQVRRGWAGVGLGGGRCFKFRQWSSMRPTPASLANKKRFFITSKVSSKDIQNATSHKSQHTAVTSVGGTRYTKSTTGAA